MREGLGQEYFEHPLVWPNTVEFRFYQKKIADIASEKNTLVILPTGLGKTIISAIVAANTIYNYRDAKVLVMAPTRPLVMQHRNTFMRLLKLREKDIVLLTGRIPSNYRIGIWEGEARVFLSTPQVVRNDLLAKRLALGQYGLLVFDECHRAVKRYAYTDIARIYVSQTRYPLILGMTASPGADVRRILDVCRNLFIEHVEHRSEEDPDVKPYIQYIDVEWKRVDLPREYLDVKSHIRSMLDTRLYWLHSKGILKGRPEYVTRRKLIEAGDELRFMLEESIEEERPRIFTAIITQSLALTLFHMLVLLETQGLWTLSTFLNRINRERMEKRSYAILANDPEYQRLQGLVDAYPIMHPKLVLLKRVVGDQLRGKPWSRMLVFTQYRDTARHLVSELKTVPNVRAERFVGQASRSMDKGLTQEEQAERIRQLENGALNALVATSIAEEGLDIPAVDHVIFYEPIPSEIRYIQRRGRTGRKTPGKVTILATNDSLDMIYLYASRRRTERMRKIAENVNSQLQPIIRTHPKPTPNPLTPLELKALEEEAKPSTIEPEIVETELETLKDFKRRVNQASRRLYMKLLERGSDGASWEQVASDMEPEGTSISVLKSAMGSLMKKELVKEIGAKRYIATSTVKKADGETYEVTIERIYRGVAVVRVNDKWRARLIPEEYNGPRSLIKKNATFKVVGELYRLNGTLCIKIKQVTQIIRR